jgi:2-polyprenyl-3-methyl-5-hydroxy-6-metoxy-1,4-benzoquinol methylase
MANAKVGSASELAEVAITAIPIEIDSFTDNDSSYGDDALSSYSTSLASSVEHYQFEHGRRYHAFREGNYVLPNDEQEKERLDIYHHLSKLILNGRLHLSPIDDKKGLRILDIGTGTGIWAIEMGDQYESATVLGNDLR